MSTPWLLLRGLMRETRHWGDFPAQLAAAGQTSTYTLDLAGNGLRDTTRIAGSDPQLWVQILAGNRVPEGAEPIAAAYAGHQFGGFSPQLGDGRAILLGEVVGRDGRRRDIQLKGSGLTPFSRPGSDGVGAIGPMLREYAVSEFMHAVGVASTRSLAVLSTGERVLRQQGYVPGGIVVRVANEAASAGQEGAISEVDVED